ncbi:MAG: hypothetical protein V1861_00490 [Candidatus Micrarchaeota archaeon]
MGGKKASVKAQKKDRTAGKLPRIESIAGLRVDEVVKSWRMARDLFSLDKHMAAITEASQTSNAALAFGIIILAGFVLLGIGILNSAEFVLFANARYDTMAEITNTEMPSIDYAILVPAAIYQFFLYVVFGSVIMIGSEGIAYGLAKITGGRGSLGQHLYASSVVWLAAGFSMLSSFLLPLPCIGIAGLLAVFFITTLYVMVYLYARTYSTVHDISLPHAITISIIILLLRFVVWAAAVSITSGALGIDPTITSGG